MTLASLIKSCLSVYLLFVLHQSSAQRQKEYHLDAGDGINLFVREVGKPSQEKIVFLHGGAGDNHENFMPHLHDLSKSYHLVFYDQTDAGKSYSASRPDYSIRLEVENLEKLRRYLKIDKLNLVGHSWGSILALSYAKTYPQNVNKILLTGSIGTDASFYQLFAQNLFNKMGQGALSRIQELTASGASRQEIHEQVMLPFYYADTSKMAQMTKTKINFEVNAAIAQDIFRSFDVKNSAKDFDFPVRVVQGKQDLLSIDELKTGFGDFQDIVFVEVDAAGHWVIVEQKEAFVDLLSAFFR